MKNLKLNKNKQPQTLVQLYRIKFEVSIRLFGVYRKKCVKFKNKPSYDKIKMS